MIERIAPFLTQPDTRSGPQVGASARVLPMAIVRARIALLLTCGEPGPREEGREFLLGRFELDAVQDVELPRFGLLRAASPEAEALRTLLLRQVMATEALGVAVVAHATCSRATALPRGSAGFAALEATVGVLRRYGWTEWVIGLWVESDGSIRSIDPPAGSRRLRVSWSRRGPVFRTA